MPTTSLRKEVSGAPFFAPKKKSSCCYGSQIEIVPEDVKPADKLACCSIINEEGTKIIKCLEQITQATRHFIPPVQDAVAQLDMDAKMEKEKDLEKIMAYKVMSRTALVVDGKVVSKGQKLLSDRSRNLSDDTGLWCSACRRSRIGAVPSTSSTIPSR